MNGKMGISDKLKSEAYVRKLEGQGINVESLKRDLKKKKDDNGQGISKQELLG